MKRVSMPRSLGCCSRRFLMITKHIRAFLPSMALAALLAGLSGLSGLSGCGWQPASSQAGTRNAPDRVQIAIHVLDPQVGEPVATLIDAILALPPAPQNGSCSPESLHEYQLVFHTADQAISSGIDKTCNTVSLEGNYKSRGGIFMMNGQFKHLFEQTLAAATFAPARPDRLTLDIQPEKGVARQSTIADARLRQQLYTKIFALSEGKAQPNCPSGEDKVAGKGKWYLLNFTQWDLPVLVNVDAYEGSCTFVSLDA